ncbi:MAG: sugar kinase [Clostridium chrysemydis]|uniref:sugar kinase n=1 Tax=Clostridium chrysemydis TaxID=2665504 RepID=UPI003F31D8EE
MKILAFGEIMMRLMPPDYKLLTQVDNLDFVFTGTGANILSGLYQMGHEVYMATTLPDNNVGRAASAQLRRLGINDQNIKYKGNHIGMYFLEVGIGKRATEVTYMNRNESSFGKSTTKDYNIDELLKGKEYIHICGISLALNKGTRECAYELAKESKKRGIKVIFDCNFRPSLWNKDDRHRAKGVYEKILSIADIVFAGEKDAELLLEIKFPKELQDIEKTEYLLGEMKRKFNIDIIIGSIRKENKQEKLLQGYLFYNDKFILSREYKLTVYDRVGTGDGFASGAIHGIIEKYEWKDIIEFATCSGVLAHTTYGDSPILGVRHIKRLMDDEYIDLIR